MDKRTYQFIGLLSFLTVLTVGLALLFSNNGACSVTSDVFLNNSLSGIIEINGVRCSSDFEISDPLGDLKMYALKGPLLLDGERRATDTSRLTCLRDIRNRSIMIGNADPYLCEPVYESTLIPSGTLDEGYWLLYTNKGEISGYLLVNERTDLRTIFAHGLWILGAIFSSMLLTLIIAYALIRIAGHQWTSRDDKPSGINEKRINLANHVFMAMYFCYIMLGILLSGDIFDFRMGLLFPASIVIMVFMLHMQASLHDPASFLWYMLPVLIVFLWSMVCAYVLLPRRLEKWWHALLLVGIINCVCWLAIALMLFGAS